ncbi:hypothetical protein WMF18_18200 [Sorangium sp. So ce315]|uniref:hypothetical protein n=1 Tax=Sorangium sp. So ce315 TaxID=3133299 RepID=UPI003F5DD6B5
MDPLAHRELHGARPGDSMMQKELLTPAAILLGSVFIAAGLYFGLQRAAPPDAAPPPASAEASAKAPPASEAPAPAPPRPAPPAAATGAVAASPGELYSRVAADAMEALEARRQLFVKQCWEPSLKKSPTPARARYLFNMTFDESGKEIARGISEVRGMDRPDAAQCLRMIPLGIAVPPPGARVAVEVEMTLP